MPERWRVPLAEIAGTPMTEGLLEEARRGPRQAPPGPSNVTRVVVAVVALAIAVAAGAFLLRAFSGQEQLPLGRAYVDPDFGWTIRVPDGWDVLERAPIGDPNRPSLSDVGSIWLANPAATGIDRGAPIETLDDLYAQMTAGGVVLAIQPMGYSSSTSYEDSPLPPQLGEPREGWGDAHAWWRANAIWHEAIAWYGPKAAPADIAAAEEAVRSITFPPMPSVPDGTASEYWLEDRQGFNLGPASRFPAGSVTRLDVEGDVRPFAEGLFVVIPLREPSDGYPRWAFTVEAVGWHVRSCSLEWDGEVFSCPDGQRWDLEGNALDGSGDYLTPIPLVRTWGDSYVADPMVVDVG